MRSRALLTGMTGTEPISKIRAIPRLPCSRPPPRSRVCCARRRSPSWTLRAASLSPLCLSGGRRRSARAAGCASRAPARRAWAFAPLRVRALAAAASKRLTVTHARPRSSVQQISWQSGLSEHSRDSRSQDYGKFPPFWWKRPTSSVVIVCCMVCCCISPRRKKANKVTVIPVVIATPAALREDETAEAGQ